MEGVIMIERLQNFSSWIWTNISDIDAALSVIVVIFGVIINLLIRLRNRYHCLKTFGLDRQTRRSMRYFVPTRAVNIDPCDQENIDHDTSFPLILFFMKAFKNSESQYFIILADSGMGKTTFLLKLYFRYKRKLFKKYRIVLLPLSDSKTCENIRNIKHKRKTILLLDSFDEDSCAMEDYKKRMQDLCNETELFYKIVVTCRTQFFPNREKEPKITGNIKFGVGKKNIEFEKYYISPFNDREILKYLEKKYIYFFQKEKFERAQNLIANCPKLVVRPMLLSYLDDLIDHSEKKYDTVYEIYDQLVKKWIEREVLDDNLLYVFSEKIAEYMYLNKTIYIDVAEILNLCREYHINLRSIEAKSRSLLNRNANGLYKFAHKSILEFFLCRKAFKEEEFRKLIFSNGFSGYDMLKLFLKEKSFDNLREILQKNHMRLESKDFRYLILSEVDLSGMNIINCRFEGCIFDKADFTGSRLAYVNFVMSHLQEADFFGARFRNIRFLNVNLRKCGFRNIDTENTVFRGADLEAAQLEGADLKGIDLREANLRMASLSWTALKGADLRGADMTGAILIDTDLREASLNGVDFRQIYLHYSKSPYFIESNDDRLDLDYDFESSLEGADMTMANLSGCNLRNINFQSAKLVFADLSNAVLLNSNLIQADLRGANLNASIWYQSDIQKVLPELKKADFTYLNIKKDSELEKIERNELFL